jgi:hypothetical protein
MLAPTIRPVENRGSSTVNVRASRMTRTPAARVSVTHPPSSATHTTSPCRRSRVQTGCGSSVNSAIETAASAGRDTPPVSATTAPAGTSGGAAPPDVTFRTPAVL